MQPIKTNNTAMKQTTTITVVTEFRDSNGQPVMPAAPEFVVSVPAMIAAIQRAKDSNEAFNGLGSK